MADDVGIDVSPLPETVVHIVSKTRKSRSSRSSSFSSSQETSPLLTQNNDEQNYTKRNSIGDGDIKKLHCHHGKRKSSLDKKARTRLVVASCLCLLFMVAEIVGGILAHSLAIVSDAAHLLTDFASFLISLFAIYLASRQPTKKLSFGWYRAEILGALTSIVLLWVLTGILVYMGIMRIIKNDYEINAVIMLITASCGVGFNIIMGTTLHQHGHSHGGASSSKDNSISEESSEIKNLLSDSESSNENQAIINSTNSSTEYGTVEKQKHTGSGPHGHSHSNINVKAAFVHVVGDLIQSVGVFIAALLIYFKPHWKIADPICTFFFSVLVLVTTLTIFRDILLVLMEGAPKGINFDEVQTSLLNIKDVKAVHDLRMWSLSLNKVALSVHLAVGKEGNCSKVLREATVIVQTKFDIYESTIQVEEYMEDMLDCTHCKDPSD